MISLASDNFLQRNENKTPRLKFDWLKERSEGIICLTGGCEGLIGKAILKNRKDDAEKVLLELRDIFEDRLYIEIMRHGEIIKNEDNEKNDYLTEPFFLEFAKKTQYTNCRN
ncbi:MAG: hypothetical protein Ta2D_03620 [Rickettsiales bacterium]|nr:MAG: hypothetical protein Ta2D_03620 [Rickettsiales bacterium]